MKWRMEAMRKPKRCPDVWIGRASQIHARAIHQLEAEIFRHPASLERLAWSISPIGDRQCIVAVDGQFVVGYLIASVGHTNAIIETVAVDPVRRFNGFCRAMVEQLREEYRLRHVLVEVEEENLDAQMVFRSLGFHCSSILTESYEDGGTGYLFEKSFPASAYRFMGAKKAPFPGPSRARR